MRRAAVALIVLGTPAVSQVVECDTCGSIALQAPLTHCANVVECFSALLQVERTLTAANAMAAACASESPGYVTRATEISDALHGYLIAYQGGDLLDALSRWQSEVAISACDPAATEAGIDAAIATLDQLFTFGCNGALPRSEARVAELPAPYGAQTNIEVSVC